MKRCQTCHRTYTDPGLNFCLHDGAPLVEEAPAAFDPQQTLIAPTPAVTSHARANPATSEPTMVASPSLQSPRTPYGLGAQDSAGRSRNPIWIIGAAVLLLALLGTVGLAAIIWMSSKSTEVANGNSGNNRNSAANDNSTARTLRGQPESSTNHHEDPPGSTNQPETSNENSEEEEEEEEAEDVPDDPPAAPFAEFTDRVGRYTGEAYNSSTGTSGHAVIDLTSVDESTGAVTVRMNFSGNLCGTGSSAGKLNRQGGMSLVGNVFCGSNFRMLTNCNFAGPARLKCAYRVSDANLNQTGVFDVSRG